jgi:hypothetical protein
MKLGQTKENQVISGCNVVADWLCCTVSRLYLLVCLEEVYLLPISQTVSVQADTVQI